MKTSLVATLAALALLSAPAIAQDVEVDAGAAAGGAVDATTDAAGAEAGADVSAGASAQSDFTSIDELTTAIGASAGATVDLSLVAEDVTIRIVRMSTLQASASGNMDAFTAAVGSNEEGLTSLRASVDANVALKAKLEAEGFTSADVVAVVHNEADNSITVYVNDMD